MAVSQSTTQRIKCVLVGDGACGKNYLTCAFLGVPYPGFEPYVLENFNKELFVDDKKYELSIWLTAGQEDYIRLRPLCYPNTDCFIICYSSNNRESFVNVEENWVSEVRHHCPNAPVVLVATEIDLRATCDVRFVQKYEGLELAKYIEAYDFVECSALENINVKKVFETAVRAATKPKNNLCSMS